jgi:hypothetical protein
MRKYNFTENLSRYLLLKMSVRFSVWGQNRFDCINFLSIKAVKFLNDKVFHGKN